MLMPQKHIDLYESLIGLGAIIITIIGKNSKTLDTIIEKVNKYNYTKDEALRKDLLQNANIRKAKKMEADLNYIILEINQQFSTLKTNHRSKENESN